jgi:hypothetical protein
MSPPTPDSVPSVCPRCRARKIDTRSSSPVDGVWTLFACATCLYVWRSTEPDENQDPDKYPAAFRLEPEDLPHLPIAPAIQPPVRQDSDGGQRRSA